MTVSASEAVFGFGCQSAKGTLATTWYRHKASRASVGGQQVQQQFPPELGGGFHPTGAFKSMAFGAGMANLNPRLEEVIGWLLYGAIGRQSEVQADTPEAGMYRHRFVPADDPRDMKWMSVRTLTPGSTVTDELGQVLKDARSAGIQLNVPGGGLVNGVFPFVAREPMLMEDIGSGDAYEWSWGNTYERYPSVPLASAEDCAFKVAGTEEKATSVQVNIGNAYTNPQEEIIVGSPYPDDFILQFQTLTFNWVYKWQDHDLFQALYTGSNVADGNGYIAWSPVPYSTTAELIVVSPGNVSGQTSPYRLRVYAPEVVWSVAGPPELVGGGWLALRMTGVAQEQTSTPTFWVDLDNGKSAVYTWPS